MQKYVKLLQSLDKSYHRFQWAEGKQKKFFLLFNSFFLFNACRSELSWERNSLDYNEVDEFILTDYTQKLHIKQVSFNGALALVLAIH